MYECLKNSIDDGHSLQDFFGNVHDKITQNIVQKHLLTTQSTELKDSLQRNLSQIETNEQSFTAGYHQDGTQLDTQLLQMKQSERQLLEQNVMTNQHLLNQIDQAVSANEHQFAQL